MTIIVCVDDRMGQAFHRRRLSRDRVLCARVLALAGGHALRMSPYSARLFEGAEFPGLLAQEDYLAQAGGDDLCFVELEDLSPWLARADRLVLYRWNRAYPSDLKFPAGALDTGWRQTGTTDFPGSSHDTITEEIYEKT